MFLHFCQTLTPTPSLTALSGDAASEVQEVKPFDLSCFVFKKPLQCSCNRTNSRIWTFTTARQPSRTAITKVSHGLRRRSPCPAVVQALATAIQNRMAEVFHVDIHPAAKCVRSPPQVLVPCLTCSH